MIRRPPRSTLTHSFPTRRSSDLADAESLFRLVEDLAPYGSLDPEMLENRLEKLYAEPNSSVRPVEVMNIHTSKRLEFETVILDGLHRRPKGDTPPLLRFAYTEVQLLTGPIDWKRADEVKFGSVGVDR